MYLLVKVTAILYQTFIHLINCIGYLSLRLSIGAAFMSSFTEGITIFREIVHWFSWSTIGFQIKYTYGLK